MVYTPGSDAKRVMLGPGKLYSGAVGAAEPTDLTTAIAAVWTYLGFTDSGSTFTSTPAYDDVEVAESLLPLTRTPTGINYTVEFALAEITAQNLQFVMNGGVITTTGTAPAQVDSFEPNAFGVVDTRTALLWVGDNGLERWIYRKALQTGAIAIARNKGAAKATIPASFQLEPVSSTVRPYRAMIATPV